MPPRTQNAAGSGGLLRSARPLEVHARGQRLGVGGPRQERVLATLLLQPNRVVSIDRLAQAAWDEALPATYRRQVQNSVAALRRQLTVAGAAQPFVTR